MKLTLKASAWLTLLMVLSQASFAEEGYKLPESPPLYDKSSGIGQKPAFDSGLILTLGVGLGQSNPTGNEGNPDVAPKGSVEVGYLGSRGPWNNMEAGLELFQTTLGHSNAEVSTQGVLARIGGGYSLGHKLMGVWSIGFGGTQGIFKGEVPSGQVVESTDSMSGTVIRAGYSFVMPMGSTLRMLAGVNFSQFSYNITDVTVEGTTTELKLDERLTLNVPEVALGLRLGF